MFSSFRNVIITNGTTLTTLALHWVGNDVIVVVAKLGVIDYSSAAV